MTELFLQLMRSVLSVIGLVPLPDTATLGVAVALLAVTVLTLAFTFSEQTLSGDSPPHPSRGIDVSTLLPQSHPDAAGHARPRAPGVARAV